MVEWWKVKLLKKWILGTSFLFVFLSYEEKVSKRKCFLVISVYMHVGIWNFTSKLPNISVNF